MGLCTCKMSVTNLFICITCHCADGFHLSLSSVWSTTNVPTCNRGRTLVDDNHISILQTTDLAVTYPRSVSHTIGLLHFHSRQVFNWSPNSIGRCNKVYPMMVHQCAQCVGWSTLTQASPVFYISLTISGWSAPSHLGLMLHAPIGPVARHD